ncbi:hypothetical protein BESB_032590 [Besnoitia besnoiti]|uniref:PDEase domain-containing protein n=1 Tax=Besnoitia besnoiti TaxID=94643 RepID=A0A2A9M6Q4_BESBE|nr:uncharacterized protein BESB_032590 [Besnoitia besnoiti]PFH31062.1 hypothetical protein BESB_032590 [Besnoitia besnoiti]
MMSLCDSLPAKDPDDMPSVAFGSLQDAESAVSVSSEGRRSRQTGPCRGGASRGAAAERRFPSGFLFSPAFCASSSSVSQGPTWLSAAQTASDETVGGRPMSKTRLFSSLFSFSSSSVFRSPLADSGSSPSLRSPSARRCSSQEPPCLYERAPSGPCIAAGDVLPRSPQLSDCGLRGDQVGVRQAAENRGKMYRTAATGVAPRGHKRFVLLPVHGRPMSKGGSRRDLSVVAPSPLGPGGQALSRDSDKSRSEDRRESERRGRPGEPDMEKRRNQRGEKDAASGSSKLWGRTETEDEDEEKGTRSTEGEIYSRLGSKAHQKSTSNLQPEEARRRRFRVSRIFQRLRLSAAQTFSEEDEKHYVEEVLHFSRFRSVPVAIAVLVISLLYTLPYVLHAFQEIMSPSAALWVYFYSPPASSPSAGSQLASTTASAAPSLQASSLQRGEGPEAPSPDSAVHTLVVISLVCWVLSLVCVLFFAIFSIFGGLFRHVEKVLCVVTAINFIALAFGECFQVLRISFTSSAAPPFVSPLNASASPSAVPPPSYAASSPAASNASEPGSFSASPFSASPFSPSSLAEDYIWTRTDSSLIPEILIMQLFFLIVLDFIFCVRIRISQWLHLCAASILVSLSLILTVGLPLRPFRLVSLWAQTVIGCFVLASFHFASRALETERRRTFLHFEVAKARVAELQRRVDTDKTQGKVAVFRLIQTLKQMGAYVHKLSEELPPEAAEDMCELDALRVQCLSIATSSENLYAVKVDFLPSDVLDMLQLPAQDSFEGSAASDSQVLLGDSLSPRLPCSAPCPLFACESIEGGPLTSPAAYLISRKSALGVDGAFTSAFVSRVSSGVRKASAPFSGFPSTPGADEGEAGEKRETKKEKKTPFVPPLVANVELLCHVGSFWPLDVLKIDEECDGNALLHVGYQLLEPFLSSGFVSCSRDVALEFLFSLQKLYRDNPYHNQVHAALVGHLSMSLCHLLDFFRRDHAVDFSPAGSADPAGAAGSAGADDPSLASHRLALTIAAIGHDAGHPGRSNSFLTQSASTLSVVYNDRSILENYHSCLTFYTLSQRSCNIFRGKTVSQYREIRKKIIELILATDMAHHFEFLSRIAARRENPDFNFCDIEEDRALVMSLCIKVADLGHCALDAESHIAWTTRLKQEFFAQGDEEKRLGLAVSPLCDRSQQGQLARSQANFIEFLFLPLAQHVSAIAPDERFERTALARARQNIVWWKRQQAELDEKGES